MQTLDPRTGEPKEKKRTLQEQLISLGKRLGFAPFNPLELQQEALEYVRKSYPNAQITDLPRSIGGILSAMRQDGCHTTCPGRDRCRYNGHIREIVAHETATGIELTVAACACNEALQYNKQAELDKIIKSSRIPQRLKDCTFESYQVRGMDLPLQAAKAVMEEASRTGQSVILGGPNGCGKTHLAVACLSESLKNGRVGVFVLVPELLQEIRESYSSSAPCQIEKAVKDADLLILDDLGSEKTTDWVGERLFTIIDSRYINKKQTIITTNAETLEQLTVMIGDRGDKICSRLYEMTEDNKVWLRNCKDYRKRNHKQKTLTSAVA